MSQAMVFQGQFQHPTKETNRFLGTNDSNIRELAYSTSGHFTINGIFIPKLDRPLAFNEISL